MFGILELLFFPYVAHPKIEKEICDGRKRIDITFNNIAENGFLSILEKTYNIPCRLVMVECKNYSNDIQNPELDQMAGRFSPNRGRFGIICCREIKSKEQFLKREPDTAKDQRGWIIHFTDDDIVYMLEQRKNGQLVDDYLLKRFDEINNC